jgi:hypothetical protein
VRALILAAACVAATPALAIDLPRFDVEAHCDQLGGLAGRYSDTIEKECFETEQRAYDKLKLVWNDAPDEVRRRCLAIATTASANYTLLKGCVDVEMRAIRDYDGKTFRY